MTRARTYLDWNATAPLCDAARAAMIRALDLVGNPSSVHAEGRAARAVIEDAREQVAALVGARPADVVFTSGATEANATVFAAGWDTIYLCEAEHDSVLAPAKGSQARRIIELPIERDGRAVVDAIAADVLCGSDHIGRGLITLQLANNETGVLQPVADVAAFAREHGLLVHTDAVQAPGRIAVDIEALGVDYLSISAHKLGGPKGVGALVLRDGAPLPALLMGGGQERRRRAGTENIAGIAGFGAAAVVALQNLRGIDAQRARRDRLEAAMLSLYPELTVIGAESPRLANTSCIAFSGKAAETFVIKYDLAGVSLSAGSACSSGKVGTSHVLRAMGIPPDVARSAIRISLGPTTTDDDIAAFLAASATILRSAAKAA
jgi:cysteine desulfurase